MVHPGFDPFGLNQRVPHRSGLGQGGEAAEAASNHARDDGGMAAGADQIQAIQRMNGDDDNYAEGTEVGCHRELHIWAIPIFRHVAEAEQGKESDPGSRILDSLVFLPVTTWQEEESSSGWMQVCEF